MDDQIEQLRRLLDPKKLPAVIKRGEYFWLEGEVYAYRTDHPLEERIYKPLHRSP